VTTLVKQHITDYLRGKSVTWHASVHPWLYTAQEIAASLHVSGKRFAKTVVLEQNGQLLLAALPADEDVDLDRLRDVLGGDVELCEEAQFAGRFEDCDVGAMPPFGGLHGIDVIVDACLARQPTIVVNGGTHEDAIELAWKDFERLGPVRLVDYGRENAGVSRVA
jgi:Ala-tRNA(Pro) deacylase